MCKPTSASTTSKDSHESINIWIGSTNGREFILDIKLKYIKIFKLLVVYTNKTSEYFSLENRKDFHVFAVEF